VPKQTVIQNERLGALLWLLRIFVLIYLYFTLIANKQSALKVQEVGDGAGGFWVESRDYDLMADEAIAKADYCDPVKRNRYSFLYDSAGAYNYTDFVCRKAPSGERFYKFLPSALYLTTFYEEQFMDAVSVLCGGSRMCTEAECVSECSKRDDGSVAKLNEAGGCVCEKDVKQDVWVAGVEEQYIAFDHVLDIRDPANPAAAPKRYSGTDPDLDEIDRVKTCIRKETGEIIDVRKFGIVTDGGPCLPMCSPENVKDAKFAENPACKYGFKFGDILAFNDITDLNVVGPKDTGDNLFQNSAFGGGTVSGETVMPHPPLRMIGGEIRVKIEYFNPADPGYMMGDHIGDHKGPVCYITFKASKKWNSMPLTQHETPPQLDGSAKYRYMYNYGWTFVFERSGFFTQYATPQVMVTLALPVVLIWMAMPEKIVAAIAGNGLGSMSVLYKRAMLQPFNAGNLLASQLARAMVAGMAFNTVSTKKEVPVYDSDGEPIEGKTETIGLIDKKRIETMMRDVFEGDRTINTEQEIKGLAKVFMTQATDERVLGARGDHENISKVEFLRLLTLADTGSIAEVTKCADADRNASCLERTFCDTSINEIKKEAKQAAASGTTPLEMARRAPTQIDTAFSVELVQRLIDEKLRAAGVAVPPSAPAPVAPIGGQEKDDWAGAAPEDAMPAPGSHT